MSLDVTSDLCVYLSDLMGALSQALNHTEQTLVQVQEGDHRVDRKLDSVMADAQKLERTVQELLDQVEFIKNSDIRGEKSDWGSEVKRLAASLLLNRFKELQRLCCTAPCGRSLKLTSDTSH